MRINVEVDEFYWKYLGVIAASKGLSKKEAMNEALRLYLTQNWHIVEGLKEKKVV